jgi:1-acyl-sn-glycerol-3-phosphate acyltransferase
MENSAKPVTAYKAPVYLFAKSVLYIFYKVFFRIRFHRAENVPLLRDGRGVILAPNHTSYLDPPAAGLCLARPVTYLAKEYLFRIPVLGWFLGSLGVLPIKMGRADDLKSIRDLIRALKSGKCVAVFPEGTRSQDGQFKEPEGGVGFLAVKSRSWVVPVYIRGTFEAYPKGARWFRPFPIDVYFGEPFIPAEVAVVNGSDSYVEVSRKVMAQIKKIKEEAERNSARLSVKQGAPTFAR